MKLVTRFPETLPGEFFVVMEGIDLKVGAEYRVSMVRNARAQVRRVDLVTREVTNLSNGATIRLYEFDQNAPESALKASATTAYTGANNDLVFTAKEAGAAGNAITVQVDSTGNADEELAITVTETNIGIVLATDGAAAVTTTAAQLKALIEATPAADALIDVAFAPGNDGTGIVDFNIIPNILTGGANAFDGVVVQQIVTDEATADTASPGSYQSLPIEGVVCGEGTQLRVAVMAGSTATKHTGDIVISGVLF